MHASSDCKILIGKLGGGGQVRSGGEGGSVGNLVKVVKLVKLGMEVTVVRSFPELGGEAV